jgi:L-alanine-DL-glutamate epimerase-like enolase superfamily enzyme
VTKASDSSERESGELIDRVRAAVIRHRLATPIVFGDVVIEQREFAVVRMESESGVAGMAYGLTRDGPVTEIVMRSISPIYVGASANEPEATFYRALWANHGVHAAGIGMRALSIVDLAAWDLAARLAGEPICRYLGGQSAAMPVVGVVGYPPSVGPVDVATQVGRLWSRGWRRFKVPIAPTVDRSIERLIAAREAAPDGWFCLDANMAFRSVEEALDFERRIHHLRLGWLEDMIPPGDARSVAAIRRGSSTPIAMGDDQGGSYHPEALLTADAVDVLRVDATTNGGVTGLRTVLEQARVAGVQVSPHMYPHVHSRLLPGLGFHDVAIEWGLPGTGVHPMDDALPQPVVADGVMEPLEEDSGFGTLVVPGWIDQQDVDDPDGLVTDLRAI